MKNLTLLFALLILSLLHLAGTSLGRNQGRDRDVHGIKGIVIHTIGGPSCIAWKVQFRPIPFRPDDAAFWKTYLIKAPVADAHFVIGRQGNMEPVIPVNQIANHALGVNDITIGIELVHRGDGKEPFEAAQIESLIKTIKGLRRQFPTISLANIVRHSDLDQQICPCGPLTYHRRQDPGDNFPLADVREAVRLASDARGIAKSTLPRLTGPSPKSYCPIF